LDWWQACWLSFPRSVPTLKFTSQLGLEAQAITDITHMDTIIRTAITDRILTMATTGLIGTAGIAITTDTIVITTIGNKGDVESRNPTTGSKVISSQFLFRTDILHKGKMKNCGLYFFDLGDSTGFAAGPLVG
jgi:hypothetical protein